MSKVSKEVIEGFVGSCLVKGFDGSLKTPSFHREVWELCCSPNKFVAIAAPRGHAKSTAVTLSYGLATLLFQERSFMLLVSDTESQACLFLGQIKQTIQDNSDLADLFGIKRDEKGDVKFLKDSESDVIVEFLDGTKFRIIAKGAEQKLRGLLWNGKRPDIIICHEKDTEIYTPETGWIKNQDYPNSKTIHTSSAYRVEYEDGSYEVVSGDHRFLTEEGWKFVWMMQPNENVVENITDDIMNDILKEEKKALESITINQKLRYVLRNGWRAIWISILLLNSNGKIKIKNTITNKLKSIAKKILVSQLNAAR